MKRNETLLKLGTVLLFSIALLACKSGPDDATLASNVKAKLSADTTLARSNINVDAKSGAVTLTGTVTEWVFSNPHSQLFFDVKDSSGTVVHWGGELQSPGNLRKDGWSKTTFKFGDQITLTVHPSRAGTPVGVVDRSKPVVLNGKSLPAPTPNAE